MPPNRLSDLVLNAHSSPRRTGALAAGRVVFVNVSAGGVPKLPVSEARLGPHGLGGDSQRQRRIHGGPTRALCLYSLEHIRALQSEGHPIAPGSTGENITLEGIDWMQLVPGAGLALGEAVVEITSYTEPCGQIRRSFRHGDSRRIDQDEHPGWSRVYARVITPGVIHTGDAARVLRAHAAAE
ncbi:MAG: MOSC domain-containing protein [Gemmatimonadota bacterium]